MRQPCPPVHEHTRRAARGRLVQSVWHSWWVQEVGSSPLAKRLCQESCEGLSAAPAAHRDGTGTRGTKQLEEHRVQEGWAVPRAGKKLSYGVRDVGMAGEALVSRRNALEVRCEK